MNKLKKILSAAISDIIYHGYDSESRVARWAERIAEAIALSPQEQITNDSKIRNYLTAIYDKNVRHNGRIARNNRGLESYKINAVHDKLQDELNRRIGATIALGKDGQEAVKSATCASFTGWATSVPVGGSKIVDRKKVRRTLEKQALAIKTKSNRTLIQQTKKMESNLNDIVATHGGAIAGIWHSKWRVPGYNYREDHKERDELIYLIRDSWAHVAGLVKPSAAGFSDEITQPGEEANCGCHYTYIYSLDKLPNELLTKKGKAANGVVKL